MSESTAAIRAALLAHYRAHRRDLPWRHTRDPYRVWVSEIMLQQTRVDTVVPRYGEFLTRFPTLETLAAASAGEVCEAWAGLGYYRRARNLHAAAVAVVAEHDGRLPGDAQGLSCLPGIGRYTAGAIASIAYGEEAPVVDGNVARVLARLHALEGTVRDSALQRRLWELAGELVQGPEPGDLNQALMELGATVCTPKSPSCERCPVRGWCAAEAAGDPTRFPASEAAVPRQTLPIAFAWIEGPRGLWLWQRPLDGLWAGLWEPPSESGAHAKGRLSERLGVKLGRPMATVEHELSHRHVVARVYGVSTPPRLRVGPHLRPFVDPLDAPLSALARKAIRAAGKRASSSY